MTYIMIGIALVAGIHACSYAQVLRQAGNQAGALIVLLFVFTSIILPIYRIVAAP